MNWVYGLTGVLIERAMLRGEKGPGPKILDIVRKVQLVAFPLVGFVVGPLVVGQSGGQ